MRVLGIDEAGRGCVLGDLVVAGFLAEAPDEAALRAAGAADSKALTPERRVAARKLLAALGTPSLRRITPSQIDLGNLNQLEEDAIVELIVAARPELVQIDALGHPATLPGVIRRLTARLPTDLRPRFVIEPKADATYAVVGAASIFAKTTRDAALDELRAAHGELGSGYPSDPKTRAWLAAWSRGGQPWPSFVRTRWATIDDLAQQTLI